MSRRTPAGPTGLPADYPKFVEDLKARIRQAQVRAAQSANQELVLLYWDIGRRIAERQEQAGWGAGVIPRLAGDLRNELPEVKGFSERNLGRMIAFFRAYPGLSILPQPAAKLGAVPIVQQPAALSESVEKVPQPAAPLEPAGILPLAAAKLVSEDPPEILQQLAAKLPWFHNVLLMEKVKDLPTRLWYMQQTLAQGWSRDVLGLMIRSGAHERQGKAVTNFAERLQPAQSDLAHQLLKDPYVFDFLTLEEPFHERELETSLVRHLEKFLIELGQGFAFVGRQVRLEVGDEDFYLDLLFYHLHLRCFVAIELKKGAFKAEHAGKMNFYCNLVDHRLRHATDSPTIGLILCQDKKRLVAEYALKGVDKAIGVSEYELTRALPKEFRSSLPSIEEIERELSALARPASRKSARKAGAKG